MKEMSDKMRNETEKKWVDYILAVRSVFQPDTETTRNVDGLSPLT